MAARLANDRTVKRQQRHHTKYNNNNHIQTIKQTLYASVPSASRLRNCYFVCAFFRHLSPYFFWLSHTQFVQAHTIFLNVKFPNLNIRLSFVFLHLFFRSGICLFSTALPNEVAEQNCESNIYIFSASVSLSFIANHPTFSQLAFCSKFSLNQCDFFCNA